jgi:hypothetical protein
MSHHGSKDEGWRRRDEGRRKKDEGRRTKEEGRRSSIVTVNEANGHASSLCKGRSSHPSSIKSGAGEKKTMEERPDILEIGETPLFFKNKEEHYKWTKTRPSAKGEEQRTKAVGREEMK